MLQFRQLKEKIMLDTQLHALLHFDERILWSSCNIDSSVCSCIHRLQCWISVLRWCYYRLESLEPLPSILQLWEWTFCDPLCHIGRYYIWWRCLKHCLGKERGMGCGSQLWKTAVERRTKDSTLGYVPAASITYFKYNSCLKVINKAGWD